MRRQSIVGAVVTFLSGLLAVFAIMQDWLAVGVLLLSISLLTMLLTILETGRYLARLVRTEGRKSRQTIRADFLSIENSIGSLLEETISTSQNVQKALKDLKATSGSHNEKFRDLEERVKKSSSIDRRHVTNSIRHMTSEVEALLQIFGRFPDTNLPMPPTGGWAIDALSLAHLISLVQDKRPRLVVELGSGTSTVWLGYVCRSIGAKLVTFDHLQEYLQKTQASVARHGLEDVVECRYAPLRPVECSDTTFQWYAPDAFDDLSEIDLLLVDGPPAATGPRARYPALPKLHAKLSEAATIVLDDAHRPDEAGILSKWQEVYPSFKLLDFDTTRISALSRSKI